MWNGFGRARPRIAYRCLAAYALRVRDLKSKMKLPINELRIASLGPTRNGAAQRSFKHQEAHMMYTHAPCPRE